MKLRRTALALLTALALASLAPAPGAHAARTAATSARAARPASAAGAYSAIGCGLGIRVCTMGGAACPVVVVATLGLCVHMIIDALMSHD